MLFMVGLHAVRTAPTIIGCLFGCNACALFCFALTTFRGFVIPAFIRVFELGNQSVMFGPDFFQSVICSIEVITKRCTPFFAPNSSLKIERHLTLVEVSAVLD